VCHFRQFLFELSANMSTIYTVSARKNVSVLNNLDTRDRIWIIFGRSVAEKVRNQMMLCFPTYLSSASALRYFAKEETHNFPEDGALVLYACNTIQLLQRSRLPFS